MTLSFAGWLLVAGVPLAALVYAVARGLRLMAVVDLVWTAGLGLAALAFWLQVGSEGARSLAVLFVLLLWSSRLSVYLLRNRVLPGREDPRYQRLRDFWGAHADRNFLFLFLAQVPLVVLFVTPVAAAMVHSAPDWRIIDTLAVLIAVLALAGEALADRQLGRFRENPANRGKVCREGLWRYSRHPNYFFEWLHWFAYVAFAWGGPQFWLSLLGPLWMYLFLRKLTGVPHAERSSLASRGEAYRTYQRTTNTFFPWKPRRHVH